ncbi:signal transducer [Coprinopsis cinerea AmutBmut pab1-1]|nr:signal transducer [Coprinopsis cinerea AmutBmut pab1-1]
MTLSIATESQSSTSVDHSFSPRKGEESLNAPENAAKQEAPDDSQTSSVGDSTDVDAETGSSDSEYLSFEESDDDDNDAQLEDTEEERMARERERQMVLEAAGLIVKTIDGVKPPPTKLTRTRSKAHRRPVSPSTTSSPPKRRAPPEAPVRRKPRPKRLLSTDKELPPIPIEIEEEQESAKPMDPVVQLDDAYARYESFKNQQMESLNINRLSVISTDSGSLRSLSPTVASFTLVQPPSPGATSSTFSLGSKENATPHKESEPQQDKYRSHFRHYFSRSRTPESTETTPSSIRKLQISGPMPLGSVTPASKSAGASPRNSVHGGAALPGSPKSLQFQSISVVRPGTSGDHLTVGQPLSAASTVTPGVDSPSRAASPTFGTSWASLVDKTALEGIPSNERKRQEAIFELINTEVAYVRDLQLIVEVFYSSMLDILSHKEITVVFANVEDILLTNTAFLSSLEERQKECRLYIDRIGDILVNHFPNMGVYLEYCVNQQQANKVLQSLIQSKPALVEHLNKLKENPATRNLDLSSYLLEPMQRITRYPLLIKQIAHYTSASESAEISEQKAIAEAKELSEKLLDSINETIRDQEGKETLKKLSEGGLWIGQGRLDLTAPTRYMGARKLLKQGVVAKAKSGRKLKAFLCSDILVLTDQSGRNLYRMPIPLAHAEVKEITGTLRDDTGFQILQPYPRGGESINLKAASPKECKEWIKQIELASRRCRHAEERAIRKGYHSTPRR